jgi:outer membrane protein assembly factor BamB
MIKPAIVGLLMGLLISPQFKADEALKNWPQWRGPTWNGVAPLADPPISWSETKNLRWKSPIAGAGWGSPVVWGDRIFLLTAIPLDRKMPIPDALPPGVEKLNQHRDAVGDWKAQRFAIVCLSRNTGQPLWSRTIREAMPHQGHHRKAGFASQSPVTDGRNIYAYFGSHGLHCYDMEGRFVWKKEFAAQPIKFGVGEGSSPALFGNTLVIPVDTQRNSYVVAIDKRTGEEIWKQDRDEESNWSTPSIFTHKGRRQVVLNGEKVRSYHLATGELLWECGRQSQGAIPMPAVGHGLVFAASGFRKDTLHAIALGQRGDLTDSRHVVWSLRRGAPYVPCPMLWGRELYLLEDQSFFSCLGAVDGEQHYLKERLPGILNFTASPDGAADRIYLLSEEGRTVVLQRGKELKVLAINQLKEKFHASPAIVGDAIYLRGDKHLFCLAKPLP